MRELLLPCYNIFESQEYPAHQDVCRGILLFFICEVTVTSRKGGDGTKLVGWFRDSPVEGVRDLILGVCRGGGYDNFGGT